MDDDQNHIMFPKPARIDKEKKRLAMQYRQEVRPAYLMRLSRQQGRLTRGEDDLPGDLPFEKLKHLEPGEWPTCEVALEETGCRGKRVARSVHHKRGRSGERMIDDGEMVACCNDCHEYIERNRSWAYSVGLLLRRN